MLAAVAAVVAVATAERVDDCLRGKRTASPEPPQEQKQSRRSLVPCAWMRLIATTSRVCWMADSEQARTRLAQARTVWTVAGTLITGLSLGQA